MAGLYTLEEKCRDYWNPLFGSVKPRKVSFLTPPSVRRLLVQPTEDFTLDYEEAVIAEITRITNGQPFLVQLIGQNLVTRYNRQRFEEARDREALLTLADL